MESSWQQFIDLLSSVPSGWIIILTGLGSCLACLVVAAVAKVKEDRQRWLVFAAISLVIAIVGLVIAIVLR